MPRSALFLCAHGSQDPRAEKGLLALRGQVQDFLPTVTVGCGVLEMGPQPLEQQIRAFLTSHQLTTVKVLPLFLLSGVHAEVDIPQAIAQVGAPVQQMPVLGKSPGLVEFLARTTVLEPDEGIVLFAHGSRREEANRQIGLLADDLAQWVHASVIPAFLKEEGSLQQALSKLHAQGQRALVLPHFLFPGGVTDYLAELIQGIDAARLGPVLSERPGFAQLAVSQVTAALSPAKGRVPE
jgi:sirohydrochlorin cobaltochelatase